MPRVIRVLEYEGSLEWLQETLSRRGVKGEYKVPGPDQDAIIREGFVKVGEDLGEYLRRDMEDFMTRAPRSPQVEED